MSGDGFECRDRIDALMRRVAVRAAGAAGLGAGPQRLFDDGVDGTCATAAFGAAAEAAVNLLGIAGKVLR